MLSKRIYTGKEAKEYATDCSKQYGEIFRLILGRSLKAGVAEGLINKAYPNLIPTFPLMKGKAVPIEEWPIWYSIKYDGVRLLAFVRNGKAILRTSTGKRLQLNSLIEAYNYYPDGVYDGELVTGDGKQAGRTKITGLVNKILLGSATDIAEEYSHMLFDYVPLESWEFKNSQSKYNSRLHKLQNEIQPVGNIRIIHQKTAHSQEELDAAYYFALKAGFEGLIARYPADNYAWERIARMIKLKATKTTRLYVDDVLPGQGKYIDQIGALRCSGMAKCGTKVVVNVGTGLSDFDRARDPEEFIGHWVEVLYNDVVRNENKPVPSLFLPRFKRIVGKNDT